MQFVQLTADLFTTQCVGTGSYRSSKDLCSTCGAGTYATSAWQRTCKVCPTRYSMCLLYSYKSTNTDAEGGGRTSSDLNNCTCPPFTGFTGTKVQILTQLRQDRCSCGELSFDQLHLQRGLCGSRWRGELRSVSWSVQALLRFSLLYRLCSRQVFSYLSNALRGCY